MKVRSKSNQSLLCELTGHWIMGAGLGLFLGLSLMANNNRHIFEMIVNSSAPELTMAVLMGVFVLILATGTTITGLIFSLMDASD